MNKLVLKWTQGIRGSRTVTNTCSYYFQVALAYVLCLTFVTWIGTLGYALATFNQVFGAPANQSNIEYVEHGLGSSIIKINDPEYGTIYLQSYSDEIFKLKLSTVDSIAQSVLLSSIFAALICLVIMLGYYACQIPKSELYSKIKNKLCREIEPKEI